MARRLDDGSTAYGSRWQRARRAYLAEHPLCVECSATGRAVTATVVDHKRPHRGSAKLFWERENWQPLCETCHNQKTGRGG